MTAACLAGLFVYSVWFARRWRARRLSLTPPWELPFLFLLMGFAVFLPPAGFVLGTAWYFSY